MLAPIDEAPPRPSGCRSTGLGERSTPKRQLVGRARRDHAQAAVVVDVPRAERDARELAQQVGLLGGERGAAVHRDGVLAVFLLDLAQPPGGEVERLVPGGRRGSRRPCASADRAAGRDGCSAGSASRPWGRACRWLNGNSSQGSNPITWLSRTLSWMPHCWPQKQQCVFTSRSGGSPRLLAASRPAACSSRCGP